MNKKFSVFLMKVLTGLTICSLLIVMTVMYGILSKSLTKEFYQRVDAEKERASNKLESRFNTIKNEIQVISLDNVIKVSLMLGVKNQVNEKIKNYYSDSNGIKYFIEDYKDGSFIPEMPESLKPLKTNLKNIPNGISENKLFIENNGRNFSIFSMVIEGRDSIIGKVYAIHELNNDKIFWENILLAKGHKIYLMQNNQIINLSTNHWVSLSDVKLVNIHDNYGLYKEGNNNLCLMSMDYFTGLFYCTDYSELITTKQNLLLLLAVLFLISFFMTMIASIFIAKNVSGPLKNIADQAFEIVHNPMNTKLKEDGIKYIEFRKLIKSFNKVLADLQESQKQLIIKSKMASLGTFAGGSAHEQRQYQQNVLTNAQRILRAMEKFSESNDFEGFQEFVKERLITIEESVRASNSLINSLLAYSRGVEEHYELMNPKEHMEHSVNIVKHSIQQDGVKLIQNINDVPEIFGSPMQIREIVLNLLTNAWHAVKDCRKEDRYISISLNYVSDEIRLVISDNGIGINPDDFDSIFDVFFTTKSPNLGTGLGLSLVSSYVDNHKGKIFVNSELDVGTCFKLQFPISSNDVNINSEYNPVIGG